MEMSAATAPRGKVTVICTQSCKEALIELVPVFEREKGFALDCQRLRENVGQAVK